MRGCGFLNTLLQNDDGGVFNCLFDVAKEGNSFATINQSVIVSQSNIHHWANNNLSIHCNGSIEDTMHTKYGRLWWVDDWSTHE
eukprot:m.134597 g.134597  ORF g.134597 m.134597 type:complete len:84 (-) comp9649_c0_seq1:1059-1310(-)